MNVVCVLCVCVYTCMYIHDSLLSTHLEFRITPSMSYFTHGVVYVCAVVYGICRGFWFSFSCSWSIPIPQYSIYIA